MEREAKRMKVVCEVCSIKLCNISMKAHEKMFDDCNTYVLCRKCYMKLTSSNSESGQEE